MQLSTRSRNFFTVKYKILRRIETWPQFSTSFLCCILKPALLHKHAFFSFQLCIASSLPLPEKRLGTTGEFRSSNFIFLVHPFNKYTDIPQFSRALFPVPPARCEEFPHSNTILVFFSVFLYNNVF